MDQSYGNDINIKILRNNSFSIFTKKNINDQLHTFNINHNISLSLITKKKKSILKDRSNFIRLNIHLYCIKDGDIIFET